MDLSQKLDILKNILFSKFDPRIKKLESDLSAMSNEVTMLKGQIQLLIQMGGRAATPEQMEDFGEEPTVMEAQVLRYRACGTTIHELSQDDPMAGQTQHVVLDHEKKRGPYKSRQEAYDFAISAFGPTEQVHFFITQDRGL